MLSLDPAAQQGFGSIMPADSFFISFEDSIDVNTSNPTQNPASVFGLNFQFEPGVKFRFSPGNASYIQLFFEEILPE